LLFGLSIDMINLLVCIHGPHRSNLPCAKLCLNA